MKKKIVLHGCDDSTYIEMEVTEAELKAYSKLAKLSEKYSTYGCQPTMAIEDIDSD